jgi:hypothetical protein
MARFNDTNDITAQSIREFATTIRLIADSFEKQAETMDSLELRVVSATHWKSAKRGVDGFGAFAGAIQSAIIDSRLIPALDAMPISVEDSQKISREIEKLSKPKHATKKKTKS